MKIVVNLLLIFATAMAIVQDTLSEFRINLKNERINGSFDLSTPLTVLPYAQYILEGDLTQNGDVRVVVQMLSSIKRGYVFDVYGCVNISMLPIYFKDPPEENEYYPIINSDCVVQDISFFQVHYFCNVQLQTVRRGTTVGLIGKRNCNISSFFNVNPFSVLTWIVLVPIVGFMVVIYKRKWRNLSGNDDLLDCIYRIGTKAPNLQFDLNPLENDGFVNKLNLQDIMLRLDVDIESQEKKRLVDEEEKKRLEDEQEKKRLEDEQQKKTTRS